MFELDFAEPRELGMHGGVSRLPDQFLSLRHQLFNPAAALKIRHNLHQPQSMLII